ncbi:MAG: sigma-70 family RNA polymerase sigma factor [Acidobacteria bacterium]|nr:sigma-70 family RNA polymerase sigma factor [Acidobacteriota bacterium]
MGTFQSLANVQPIAMTSSTSITELYERHYMAVYRTALRVTGNPADAEDVLQTVFLRILNRGERSELESMPEAYFRRAAANASLDLLRWRISHAETELNEASPNFSTEDRSLLKEQLRCAIAALEKDDAVLFLLRYVEGLSNGELASLFGQEKNNIAVRLHRIRQSLQVEMERH